MAVTRKDTAALAGIGDPDPEVVSAMADKAPDVPAAEPEETEETEGEQTTAPLPFISEGVRQDLEIHGKATDPVTGAELVMDRETGKVTATFKT